MVIRQELVQLADLVVIQFQFHAPTDPMSNQTKQKRKRVEIKSFESSVAICLYNLIAIITQINVVDGCHFM
jgi:nitrate reductase NapE component